MTDVRDGMDRESRERMVEDVRARILAAVNSIDFKVEAQTIGYYYPGDEYQRIRAGRGSRITIEIDGGLSSGQIGIVPVGTFLEEDQPVPAAADATGQP